MTRREILQLMLIQLAPMSMPLLSAETAEAKAHRKAVSSSRLQHTHRHPRTAQRRPAVNGSKIRLSRCLVQTPPSGRLSLYNVHTQEKLRLQYLDSEGYPSPEACQRLNEFFRCQYTGEVKPIDPELFVLLDSIRQQLGAAERSYELFSGYRSPSFNRILAREDHSVARKSYHIRGMAADIALDGVRLKDIAKTAKQLDIGGVGRYDRFVHVDVGPVRCW